MARNIYHESIAFLLDQSSYSGRDVKVIVDTISCGIWLWEENSKTHVHFIFSDLLEFLGISDELVEYINSRETLETSWRFINPARLRRVCDQ